MTVDIHSEPTNHARMAYYMLSQEKYKQHSIE